jgi:glycosyltransferase involved in cell wall biosynthesis
MNPLVSIIIPTYNRATIVPATIASVLAQTYPAIEIVVVDDGSTDDTAAVVARFGERVRYVRQENQGVERARSRGIRVSSGAYLSFLDDDDLLLPEKIARQTAVLEARPEVDLVHCGFHYVDRNGRHLETTGRLPEGDVRHQLAWGCFPWSGGPLVRREAIERIGEDEHRDWFGDWGMWLRVALAGSPFACVQEPLGCYRIVPGSMTDDKVANCERLVFNILDTIYAEYALPEQSWAERDQIYASWHAWLAWRYYSGGHWDDGQRSLNAAVARWPALLSRPEELLQRLRWDALSARGRVNDPERFVATVFAHLPAALEPALAPYREPLLGQIQTSLAMHAFRDGRLTEAQGYIREALRRDPELQADPARFTDAVREYARQLPEDEAVAYLEAVFRNLPPEAAVLRRVQAQTLGELNAARAFAAYAAGRRREVPARVIAAARRHPAVLKNRGMLSIFARSLPALIGVGGGRAQAE